MDHFEDLGIDVSRYGCDVCRCTVVGAGGLSDQLFTDGCALETRRCKWLWGGARELLWAAASSGGAGVRLQAEQAALFGDCRVPALRCAG